MSDCPECKRLQDMNSWFESRYRDMTIFIDNLENKIKECEEANAAHIRAMNFLTYEPWKPWWRK